jgi:hypothetical protein
MSVSGRVLSASGTEVQEIAGLLHDTAAEDQGGEAALGVDRKWFASGHKDAIGPTADAKLRRTRDKRPTGAPSLASPPQVNLTYIA